MSAQPCLRSTPLHTTTHSPSHPTAASHPSGRHSDRRGNPILWSSTSHSLLAQYRPLQLFLKEGRGDNRGQQQERPAMALGEAVALKGEQRQSWEAGSDKTSAHLLHSSYHPYPQCSSHFSTPSIRCSQPALCFSAPRALCFRAVHTQTTIVQTLDCTDEGFVFLAHSRHSVVTSPRSQVKVRDQVSIRNLRSAPNQTIRSQWTHYY